VTRLSRALLILLVLPCLGFEWPGRVERLRYELRKAEPERRREVVRQLGGYPLPQVEGALLGALEDDEPMVRLEAAAAAGRVGLRKALPILLDWLGKPQPEQQRAAARALGKLGDGRALEPLVRALGDSDASVRRSAVGALSTLGGGRAITAILGVLDDADLSIRMEAVVSLGELGDPRAVVPLLGQLRDPSTELRVVTLEALGRLGDARALPALTQALDDDGPLPLRLAAAAALGRIGDGGGVRSLERTLASSEPTLVRAAIAALGSLRDNRARTLLAGLVSSEATAADAISALRSQLRQLRRRARTEARSPRTQTPPPDEARGPSKAPKTKGGRRQRAAPPSPAAEPPAQQALQALLAELMAGLQAGREDSVRLGHARALAQLAGALPLEAVVPRLLELLQAEQNPKLARALMLTLGRSGSEQALMPLLVRLAEAPAGALDPTLDALEALLNADFPRPAAQHPSLGLAADPLLSRLEQASAAERVRIVGLLGRVGAPRAVATLLPLLDHEQNALRLATLGALGAMLQSSGAEASDATRAALMAILQDDPSAELRLAAARALEAAADAARVGDLTGLLEGDDASDRHAIVVALGGALARLQKRKALDAPIAQRALEALARRVADDDAQLGDRALHALALWGTRPAMEQLVLQLRSPSSRRRATATWLLSHFADPQAREVLRYAMEHGVTRVATAAAAALGEVGDGRDLAALQRMARRRHWPVPGAIAYAMARLAQRGVVKKHSARRALCELGGSREPFVRANVAAAMASLGAAPCERGPDPARWLAHGGDPMVRTSAALWLSRAAGHGALGSHSEAEVEALLERCAQRDIEPSVRAICAEPRSPELREPALVYAYDRDAETLLAGKLLALRMADGTAFIGYSDLNGVMRLPQAAKGPIVLDAPGQLPLEAPDAPVQDADASKPQDADALNPQLAPQHPADTKGDSQ